MDHSEFKANQTAAVYVADGLDEQTQEAFELHLMGCPECVEDVEAWRTIKLNLPSRTSRPSRPPAALTRHAPALAGWRMAASLAAGAVLGAAGGWFGQAWQAPDLDSTQTAFFNVPALTRAGDECTPLRLAPDTRVALLRVPGVARDRRVIALDSDKRELPASRYTSRVQADGSQLLRIEAGLLDGRAVHLEARGSEGLGEPLGCVTGAVVAR